MSIKEIIILNGVIFKYKVLFLNYKGMRFVYFDLIFGCFFNKNIVFWKIKDDKKVLIIGFELMLSGGIY